MHERTCMNVVCFYVTDKVIIWISTYSLVVSRGTYMYDCKQQETHFIQKVSKACKSNQVISLSCVLLFGCVHLSSWMNLVCCKSGTYNWIVWFTYRIVCLIILIGLSLMVAHSTLYMDILSSWAWKQTCPMKTLKCDCIVLYL